MKYQITKTYSAVETTCGELVRSVGVHDINKEFLDPMDIDKTYFLHKAWGWIEEQKPSKKLYLLTEIESKGGVI